MSYFCIFQCICILYHHVTENESYIEEDSHLRWLQKHIVPQYWKDDLRYMTIADTTHASSNLLIPMEDSRRVRMVTTEGVIVRETLWVLQGVATTYIYRYVECVVCALPHYSV